MKKIILTMTVSHQRIDEFEEIMKQWFKHAGIDYQATTSILQNYCVVMVSFEEHKHGVESLMCSLKVAGFDMRMREE